MKYFFILLFIFLIIIVFRYCDSEEFIKRRKISDRLFIEVYSAGSLRYLYLTDTLSYKESIALFDENGRESFSDYFIQNDTLIVRHFLKLDNKKELVERFRDKYILTGQHSVTRRIGTTF